MAKKPSEKDIKLLMETLSISKEEALEVWAFDNEETDNEFADELTEKANKAETSKTTKKKGSPLDKVKHQKAKKKADALKEEIVNTIRTVLTVHSSIFINPQDLTSTKTTFKDREGNYYSVSITKHKSKPDGYQD